MAHQTRPSQRIANAARGSIALLLVVSIIWVSLPMDSRATPVEAQAATMVLVNPPGQDVILGNFAAEDIVIQNVAGLYGAEVHLSFAPALLQVQDADPSKSGTQIGLGPLLTAGTYFVALNQVDNDLGTVDMALTQLNPTPAVSGTGVLAHIVFQTRSIGASPIHITSLILADRNGNQLMPASRAPRAAIATQDGLVSIRAAGITQLFLPLLQR